MKKCLFVIAASLALASPAFGAKAHDSLPLHSGSYGQRVKDLQWLLGGHKPNVFTKVKGTFKWEPNGSFGARTKSALLAYKFRIGYPKAGECGTSTTYLQPTAGQYFFDLLTGKKQRPTCWVVLAAKRIKLPEPGISIHAQRIRVYEVSQLGVTEHPLGSNSGVQVHTYQSATGAYNAAWCVSFQQYSFLHTVGFTFADKTAGVFYAVGYGRNHGWLNAKAKVGAIVAFLDGQGHMGYVVKVTASGFVSTEGNQNNGVNEVFHAYGSRSYVFIYIPGVS